MPAHGSPPAGAAPASLLGQPRPLDSQTATAASNDEKSSHAHVLTDQTNFLPTKKIITVFLACSTVTFTALWDQTSLAASLYTVSTALNAGSQSAWIAGAFFLTSTSFQLIYGHLSDIFSRKTALVGCLAIFFVGSLASSLAQTALQLIIFRAITGIGGGGLLTLAQTIVSDVVRLRERGKYQGILGAVVAIANAIAPVSGGALSSISSDSWRWIFRINLFLAAVAMPIITLFTPFKEVKGRWQDKVKLIDYVGSVLTLASSTLIVLALEWAGGEYPWGSGNVIAPLVVGLGVAGAFVLWEWKGARHPVMPMRIFQKPLVVGACITSFINGWLFVVQVYYIPAFFQLTQGLSPVKAGALLLPITLTQTVFSTGSGLVIHWTGRFSEILWVGWILWAVGLGLYSTFDAQSSSIGKAIGFGILAGAGVGQTLQPLLIAIQAGVERRDLATITCTRTFVRNLGSTLGLAVAGTLINSSIRSTLAGLELPAVDVRMFVSNPQAAIASLPAARKEQVAAAVTEAYERGFKRIFWVGAGLAAFAFFVSFFMIGHIDLESARSQKAEASVAPEQRLERGEKEAEKQKV